MKSKLPRIVSLVVSVIGIIVMAGWVFDIPLLKSISPAWISMKFDTAACFFLSGIMLYCIVKTLEGESDKTQIIIFAASLLILLFMGTILFSLSFGVYTGVEELFVKDTLTSVKTVVPGQPSLPTMVNFILVSLAGILAMTGAKNIRPKLKIIGLAVGIVGALAVAGYASNLPVLYYYLEGINSAMAFHTALLFVLLGIGLACL